MCIIHYFDITHFFFLHSTLLFIFLLRLFKNILISLAFIPHFKSEYNFCHFRLKSLSIFQYCFYFPMFFNLHSYKTIKIQFSKKLSSSYLSLGHLAHSLWSSHHIHQQCKRHICWFNFILYTFVGRWTGVKNRGRWERIWGFQHEMPQNFFIWWNWILMAMNFLLSTMQLY